MFVLYSSTPRRFICCTVESEVVAPSLVMRNMRQVTPVMMMIMTMMMMMMMTR